MRQNGVLAGTDCSAGLKTTWTRSKEGPRQAHKGSVGSVPSEFSVLQGGFCSTQGDCLKSAFLGETVLPAQGRIRSYCLHLGPELSLRTSQFKMTHLSFFLAKSLLSVLLTTTSPATGPVPGSEKPSYEIFKGRLRWRERLMASSQPNLPRV